MFPIFLLILKFCTAQRIFWRTSLMGVRRKALEVIIYRYVSDFPRHPQVLYRSNTVLTHYSDECQTQSFRSYYFSLFFQFSSPSWSFLPTKWIPIKYPSLLWDATLNQHGRSRGPATLKALLRRGSTFDQQTEKHAYRSFIRSMEAHKSSVFLQQMKYNDQNVHLHWVRFTEYSKWAFCGSCVQRLAKSEQLICRSEKRISRLQRERSNWSGNVIKFWWKHLQFSLLILYPIREQVKIFALLSGLEVIFCLVGKLNTIC